jgi:hypothetical protein
LSEALEEMSPRVVDSVSFDGVPVPHQEHFQIAELMPSLCARPSKKQLGALLNVFK